MTRIVSRADWNAVPPRAAGRYAVSWVTRTEFFVHHTDGPTSQAVRSIQDFHMGPSRRWGDIGYNFLVDHEGRIYEGRGWLTVGAHCPGHNRTGIGVAFIGRNNPTDAALRSIRWLYDEACRRAGRKLKKLGHGDRYNTACPGPILQAWVDDGMPADDLPEPEAPSWTETLVKTLPTLGLKADNFDVKTLRAALFSRGAVPTAAYEVPGLEAWLERTEYDAELAALVSSFQQSKGLAADGVCGPKTWPAALRVA